MRWLWRPGRSLGRWGAWGLRALQVTYLALRSAYLHRLPFQANALTFISLLALVPALAISFSLAKGLGFSQTLRQTLIDNELLANQQKVLSYILDYVEHTSVSTLGAVGLAALVMVLIFTISSMEETFNRIWEVSHQRSWLRKFTDYLSVLIIFPLLVLGATGAWAALSSHWVLRWLWDIAEVGGLGSWLPNLGPFLLLVAAFVFLYLFLPNTRVPLGSAFLAGAVAAALWLLVQHFYIVFQVGVARYNAIYGGFASLPLFMVWMQVSWQVILFGAELAHAHHVCRHGPPPRAAGRPLSPAQQELLGLKTMLAVAACFHRGQPGPTPAALARTLNVPQSEVNRLVRRLEDAGLLTESEGQGRLLPARSLDTITLEMVWRALRGQPQGDFLAPQEEPSPEEKYLLSLALAADQAARQSLAHTTLLDLVRRPAPDNHPTTPGPKAQE